MKKKCGNCLNQYTWDCPRVETRCDDEDICNMYSNADIFDDAYEATDWSEEE